MRRSTCVGQDLSHVLLVRLEGDRRVRQRRRQDLLRLDALVLAEHVARDLQLADLHVEWSSQIALMRASVSCCSIDQYR